MAERDRTVDGKPQNARPRDALGRPLPYGEEGVERVPEDLQLEPDEAITEAQRLLDHGYPFHAHEVLEGTWKSAPADERTLWQGLAQLTVGLTHLLRDNPAGAASLLRQGEARIRHYEDEPPHGLDIDGLAAWAEHLLTEIARGEPIPAPPIPRLRLP
ncbi:MULTISPECIES: DUF309 domain-containing protein [Rhodococcus]|jgi:hypothetical protein|uniref:DUF309 domain-containing protein n=1 Tax=Rhodococcus aetherivorans TaxID=191292 RepID=A0A059MI97_9NOCA|nr:MULTISPECIES: DUF309 domain-containing protein [Rhodococcus]ETT23871.1 protein of unknown function DUF309 [Rhodococcus rhodochrous ATCC 21198]NCL74100.1 hypothetical protein [Rhodococcus sp. YH1]OOL31813.1 hypothetical protein GQ85_11355 [Rhodococcus rhodochrous]AKE91812.1 hypothetical protein AAT18_24105 [Rhodococcus aetherivorans]ANZ23343.1 hypothetical protein A4U64_00455 [Rhodococcus sp. WB1]